jgi:hypothetical protein
MLGAVGGLALAKVGDGEMSAADPTRLKLQTNARNRERIMALYLPWI